MGSVSEHFSGIASGINNAMTRISNVFANAIFGALAVLLFTGALQNSIANIKLDTPQKKEVMARAVDLGNAKAPDSVSAPDREIVQQAYRSGFIDAYADIMRLSAGLAFAGALMSILFIHNKALEKK
jgi:hypothetical protein